MPLLEVVFDVPPEIVGGIANGALERAGGVIREQGSKQVVMWLREGTQIANNSNLAGGVLKSLLNVSSGGLTGVAFGALDAVVAANRHNQIMQQFSTLTNLVTIVGGIGIVNLGVSAISLAVLVKRFRDIEKQLEGLFEELQKDRNSNLQAGIDAAQDAATAAKVGDIENKRFYARQAIGRLRQARIPILDNARELQTGGDNEKLLAHVSLAMQVDTVRIRCYLANEDLENAKEHLDQALADYREMVRLTVSRLLGDRRAVYFHYTVSEEDLWRFVGIRKWLSDRDVTLPFLLQETMFAERRDFWNQELVKDIDAADKRRSIRERLSRTSMGSLGSFPPHLRALAMSDAIIENFQRLEGFHAEIKAIERLGLSHSEWEQQQEEALAKAEINLAEHDDYVLFVDTQWLGEQSDTIAA